MTFFCDRRLPRYFREITIHDFSVMLMMMNGYGNGRFPEKTDLRSFLGIGGLNTFAVTCYADGEWTAIAFLVTRKWGEQCECVVVGFKSDARRP